MVLEHLFFSLIFFSCPHKAMMYPESPTCSLHYSLSREVTQTVVYPAECALECLWNALAQHLTLTSTTIAAFKVKPNTYFQELFVQRCDQRMLEQCYINDTIMITENAELSRYVR